MHATLRTAQINSMGRLGALLSAGPIGNGPTPAAPCCRSTPYLSCHLHASTATGVPAVLTLNYHTPALMARSVSPVRTVPVCHHQPEFQRCGTLFNGASHEGVQKHRVCVWPRRSTRLRAHQDPGRPLPAPRTTRRSVCLFASSAVWVLRTIGTEPILRASLQRSGPQATLAKVTRERKL